VTMHKLENIGCNHKTRTVLPHPPYNPHLAATSLEPSKMPSVGKGLGVMTRLLKKWRSGFEYKIQTYWKGTGRGEMLLFLTGSLLLKLMEIM
jgi:hypothetical protein